MRYRRDKSGNEISQLGYGCMRFTRKGNSIDLDKAEAEIMRGLELGINYFDTAYIYPGNEEALGKIVERNNIRDKIKIATKLPQYLMKKPESIEKTFNEELTRLRTDYIDYYLMHMFTDIDEWYNLQGLGIEKWIEDKKAEGKIRNVGFSYHGDTDMFLKVLNAYDWDFCQIQYNYLDENSQAGRKGLEAAKAKNVPVIIMEPLRGGKLVNMLPEDALKIMKESGHDYTPAEWGLRWLWDQEGVTCILSGMNSMQMVEENCRIADKAGIGEFGEKEFGTIDEVKKAIKANEKVGCTGCRYCMPCPMGVDIPGNFYYYNLTGIEKKSDARHSFFQNMCVRKDPGFASQCVECGKCEKHCPQHIEIRKKLKEADKVLRPPIYRAAIPVIRKFLFK